MTTNIDISEFEAVGKFVVESLLENNPNADRATLNKQADRFINSLPADRCILAGKVYSSDRGFIDLPKIAEPGVQEQPAKNRYTDLESRDALEDWTDDERSEYLNANGFDAYNDLLIRQGIALQNKRK